MQPKCEVVSVSLLLLALTQEELPRSQIPVRIRGMAASSLRSSGGLTSGITIVILSVMKTAISLPDPLFKAGERHASRFRLSRSELYASALREYLARHNDDAVTASLNRVYSSEPSRLDPALRNLQLRTLGTGSWK